MYICRTGDMGYFLQYYNEKGVKAKRPNSNIEIIEKLSNMNCEL